MQTACGLVSVKAGDPLWQKYYVCLNGNILGACFGHDWGPFVMKYSLRLN